jgi:hypothetical protein
MILGIGPPSLFVACEESRPPRCFGSLETSCGTDMAAWADARVSRLRAGSTSTLLEGSRRQAEFFRTKEHIYGTDNRIT